MTSTTEMRPWKEINKEKKERRKKWNEQKNLKKINKEKLKEIAENIKQEKNHKTEVRTLPTISIAVPGSILDNAQSPELRTYLAGQIARAACIFQIDEVIVFDDFGDTLNVKKSNVEESDGVKSIRQCCVQLARILQYLECPQYLRKYFFPIHNDLKYAGVLNPLDTPHHLRQNDNFSFREGVVTNKPVKEGNGSYVNIGLLKDVKVDKVLSSGIRVTVRLKQPERESKKILGEVVSPNVPRLETGVYWGYSVRCVNSLAEIFSKSPYKNGYDLTIGTSDKGTLVDEVKSLSYTHALIVFGGLHGLEAALESDESLKASEPSELFDHYLNTLPQQGSRTIRTEEAIIVTMAALRSKLTTQHKLANVTMENDNMSKFN